LGRGSRAEPRERDLREQKRGVAHSEAQGRRGQIDGQTKDLTWGYKTPKVNLLILQIRQMPRAGVQ